jgi:hypothetical protein
MSSTCADRGYSGSSPGLRLCMVMHVGSSRGLAHGSVCRAAGRFGNWPTPAKPGQRVSAKDPSPKRDARPTRRLIMAFHLVEMLTLGPGWGVEDDGP